jgi:hypothetical protein
VIGSRRMKILGLSGVRHRVGTLARAGKVGLAMVALGTATVSGPAAASSSSVFHSSQALFAGSFARPVTVPCASASTFEGLGTSWLSLICAPTPPAPPSCHGTSTCTPVRPTAKRCTSASSASGGGAVAMSSACSSSGSATSVACTSAGCVTSSSGRGASCSSGAGGGCRAGPSRGSAACSSSGASSSCATTRR